MTLQTQAGASIGDDQFAVALAIALVDPKQLMFSTSEQRAQQFPELLAEIRQLQENQRAAAIYRAQGPPEVSQNFRSWLKITLEQQEQKRSSSNLVN